MDVDHPRAGVHGGFNRLFDGVRDVVELEVEEDARAGVDERPHERGALAREQAVADLESAGDAAQRGGQLHRALAGVDVERD